MRNLSSIGMLKWGITGTALARQMGLNQPAISMAVKRGKGIIGSDNQLIVGIDIAKDKHHAFFGTARGQSLWRRLIFTNDLTGYQHLMEQVATLMGQHNLENVVFGLEPTSNYHKPLTHWLTEIGYLVVLVAGKAVKDNRELLDGRWDKNDTKDSANVADLISQGKCLFYENPEADILALRNLLSVRRQLKNLDKE